MQRGNPRWVHHWDRQEGVTGKPVQGIVYQVILPSDCSLTL